MPTFVIDLTRRLNPPTSRRFEGDGKVVLTWDPPLEPDEGPDDSRIDFVEEPLGMGAAQGFGYLQVEFGDRLGPGKRYEILRKLGWGQNSSVWLAKDTVNNRFVTIKAMTGYETYFVKMGIKFEAKILKRLSEDGHDTRKTHCLHLLDAFIQTGKDKEDWEHSCVVTDVCGPSVSSLRTSSGRFSAPVIKKILLDVLVGLSYLHSRGIVHLDLHLDNIMVELPTGQRNLDIETFIKTNPSERHPPQRTLGKKFVRAAKSQPLPAPPSDSLLSHSFIIGDFGDAQFLDQKVSDEILPADVRPPEAFLELPWNHKVDIWAFGCMVFDLIYGHRLFDPRAFDLPETEAALLQILDFTDERFPSEICQGSPIAKELLDPETGRMKKEVPMHLKDVHQKYKSTCALESAGDIEGAHALIKRCLRLNLEDRPSAEELLGDPWINSKT